MQTELNDSLNAEQLAKQDVTIEDADDKGVTRRQRVTNQTAFDTMLIRSVISVSMWEAANRFSEAFGSSGGFIPSLDLSVRMDTPRSTGRSTIGDQRMTFSAAYRAMDKWCSDDSMRTFMRLIGNPENILRRANKDEVTRVAHAVSTNLRCLSRFYGVQLRADPRSIIKRQVIT